MAVVIDGGKRWLIQRWWWSAAGPAGLARRPKPLARGGVRPGPDRRGPRGPAGRSIASPPPGAMRPAAAPLRLRGPAKGRRGSRPFSRASRRQSIIARRRWYGMCSSGHLDTLGPSGQSGARLRSAGDRQRRDGSGRCPSQAGPCPACFHARGGADRPQGAGRLDRPARGPGRRRSAACPLVAYQYAKGRRRDRRRARRHAVFRQNSATCRVCWPSQARSPRGFGTCCANAISDITVGFWRGARSTSRARIGFPASDGAMRQATSITSPATRVGASFGLRSETQTGGTSPAAPSRSMSSHGNGFHKRGRRGAVQACQGFIWRATAPASAAPTSPKLQGERGGAGRARGPR